jgi:hypothetical protein
VEEARVHFWLGSGQGGNAYAYAVAMTPSTARAMPSSVETAMTSSLNPRALDPV